MSMLKQTKRTYDDGRTKQSFRDETDINKILKRAQKTGTISHLQQFEGRYGDFTNFDFFDAQLKLAAGREIFDALPSEIRNEFNQSQGDFFKYVNDPANKDRLNTLLPGLAAPGRQNVQINQNQGADAPSEPQANEQPKPEAPPAAERPTPAGDPPAADTPLAS